MNDLKLTPTGDGMEITIDNGAPELTASIQNAVFLSLFTGPYWGNLIVAPSKRYTSRIPEIMRSGLLSLQTRLDVIEEAKNALAWMTDNKVAARVDVRAEIPSAGTLYLAITIYEPANETGQEFRFGLNWEAQKITILEAA